MPIYAGIHVGTHLQEGLEGQGILITTLVGSGV